jgi:hypothetical protein
VLKTQASVALGNIDHEQPRFASLAEERRHQAGLGRFDPLENGP